MLTSICSTYFINYNNYIQKFLSKVCLKIGIKDITSKQKKENRTKYSNEIIFLGFYQTASSFIHELTSSSVRDGDSLKSKVTVIDFNPEVHKSLKKLGINALYGDISHADTLHHAGIENAKIVISTIPDTLLVGTNNLKIIKSVKDICPNAKIIATSENVKNSLTMYKSGAHYVYMSRILSAQNLIEVINSLLDTTLQEGFSDKIKEEIDLLENRNEVIG